MLIKSIIVGVIVALAVVALGGVFKSKNETAIPVSNNTIEETEEVTASRYVEYQTSIFDNLTYNRRVLFFYADWCPTCRPADKNFEAEVEQIPEDLVVIRVNYNDTQTSGEEKDLAKKYNVTYQHTFVQIDNEGNEVAKWNGGQMEELLTNIKE